MRRIDGFIVITRSVFSRRSDSCIVIARNAFYDEAIQEGFLKTLEIAAPDKNIGHAITQEAVIARSVLCDKAIQESFLKTLEIAAPDKNIGHAIAVSSKSALFWIDFYFALRALIGFYIWVPALRSFHSLGLGW